MPGTIQEQFTKEKLSKDFILHKFEGPYWINCNKFIMEHWDRKPVELSAKQRYWFDRILDDCIEKRIEDQ